MFFTTNAKISFPIPNAINKRPNFANIVLTGKRIWYNMRVGGKPTRISGLYILVYQQEEKPHYEIHDCADYDGPNIRRIRGFFLFPLHRVHLLSMVLLYSIIV